MDLLVELPVSSRRHLAVLCVVLWSEQGDDLRSSLHLDVDASATLSADEDDDLALHGDGSSDLVLDVAVT